MQKNPALLEVRGLRTTFRGEHGEVRAVDGVDLRVERGRTLGIVGESGCGKSVTALSIMGLVPQPGRIAAGEIFFDGEDLRGAKPERLRDLRGDRLAMIFQEPMTSLNPAFPVGDQIAETVLRHRHVSKEEANHQSIEMLRRVRMPSPERRAKDYPHQLSGGMRQRVMIAMALACNPKLLIADEPTTALDVTIQAQILELMRTLREELGTAIILITHDLGVIAELADEVAVMYVRQDHRVLPGGEAVRRTTASLHRRPARLDPAPAPRARAPRRDRGLRSRRCGAAARLSLSPQMSVCDRSLFD